jgi:tripartite-type tricarboxylate transporter receptor subunit TctC
MKFFAIIVVAGVFCVAVRSLIAESRMLFSWVVAALVRRLSNAHAGAYPILRRGAFLAVSFFFAVPALAQSWPVKPVKLITTASPGQSIDLMLRMVAERLSRGGRAFYVENLPGGAGVVGAQAAARSAPDGYTFYLGGLGFVVTDRMTMRSLPYDVDRDFTWVAKLYDAGGFGIAAHPDLPVKSIGELIAMAKSRPGNFSAGTENIGAPSIASHWFVKVSGIEVLSVPYKTPAQMLQDAAGGRLQYALASLPMLESYVKSGRLRLLGVTTARRFPGFEEVPTVGETLPGFRMGGLGILVAPAGAPGEIVQRMNRDVDAIVREREYVQRLLTFGFTVTDAGTPASIAEFVRAERENWAKVIAGLGITPQ